MSRDDKKDEVIAGYEKKSAELTEYLNKLELAYEKLKQEGIDKENLLNSHKSELRDQLEAAHQAIRKLELEKAVVIKERDFWQRFSGAPRTSTKPACTCKQPACCLQIH